MWGYVAFTCFWDATDIHLITLQNADEDLGLQANCVGESNKAEDEENHFLRILLLWTSNHVNITLLVRGVLLKSG